MNTYEKFAGVYDSLMNRDINYNFIADYIENLFDFYDVNPDIVCELACGTGNITIPLAMRGYDMIGVDRSFQMLDIARSKSSELDKNILFLNQNMSKLDLYGSAGAFICMIDGLNYMLIPSQIENLFYKIKNCFLDTDGIFIFDISTRYKLKNTLGNNTFIHDDGKIFYTWENKYFEKSNISRMDLSFFKRNKNNTYSRFDEVHLQRAHSVKEITFALKKAGFTKIDTYGAFSFNKPENDEQRIIFVAQ